jgi:hypothetical protein
MKASVYLSGLGGLLGSLYGFVSSSNKGSTRFIRAVTCSIVGASLGATYYISIPILTIHLSKINKRNQILC